MHHNLKTTAEYFLSCDWGTSSLRLKLVDCKDGTVLAEQRSAQGIAETFNLWQETGGQNNERKAAFYLSIIGRHIEKIEEKVRFSLGGIKLIISGMASSSLGFIDIPYNDIPLNIDGSALKTAQIAASNDFSHDVLVISGVRTSDDVMRGEETQLIGCIDPGQTVKNELFIFPGTHSKHISVKDNHVAGFKTFMTGEFFELLSQKSILKNSVESNSGSESINDLMVFKDGVKTAVSENLLHSVFTVRMNHLFNKLSPQENFNYLSGLLIGAEMQDLAASDAGTINLLCGPNLAVYYQTALRELIPAKNVKTFPAEWVDGAAARGHHKIGCQLKIFHE